jgi:SAM-dependent methyltransferase
VSAKPTSDEGERRGFDRTAAAAEARRFFDELWSDPDPWELEGSEFEQRRFARQLALLEGRRYQRALEIGCGGGSFTRMLAPLCAELVAIDVSERAIERARAASGPGGDVEYRVANVMDLDLEREGTWDLVVLTETAYYLGWLYPMFDVGWLAHSLRQATRPGGRLFLGNAIWAEREEGLLSPWLIYSYRDLFRNVGYRLEREETMRGTKDTVEFEVLMSLLVRSE